MRVNGLCNSSPGMAENHFYCCIIDTSGVKHGCASMTAFVRRMVHSVNLHHGIKPPTKPVVWHCNPTSIFQGFEERKNFLGDRNPSNASLCLAMLNVYVSLSNLDVGGTQGKQFADTESCIDENQNGLNVCICIVLPQAVNFRTVKGRFL